MNKLGKILLILLTVCCAALCAFAVACGADINWREPVNGVTDDGSKDANNPNGDLPFYYPEGTNPDDYIDKENRYVISTVSKGGIPIDGVRITVKKDGATVVEGISENGGVQLGIPLGDYDLECSNLPLGYTEDKTLSAQHLTSETTKVKKVFTSSVINSSVPAGYIYNIGDVMYDFKTTDADGRTVVLSEVLNQKKAVVINFWATWCAPCVSEFPALNAAYASFTDSVEVIALSTTDSNSAVKSFKTSLGLNFFMSADSANIYDHIADTSIPVSLIVDRYGVIAYYHKGSELNQTVWEDNFRRFTADDYEQNIQDVETGGDSGEEANVAPPTGLEAASDAEYAGALLDSSIAGNYDLQFYGPDPETRDGMYNWPFVVNEEQSCISPSNQGTVQGVATENTWSILYTDISLEADEILSVDIKMNNDPYDYLYIILNNSRDYMFERSGSTNNWETIELYTATRHTDINITFLYTKNNELSPSYEFVGIRNLKVSKLNINSSDPIDLRTEAATYDGEAFTYKTVYLGTDGFYHVQEGAAQNEATDSMLFVDINSATLFTDIHLSDMHLYDDSSDNRQERIKSLYLISYFHPKMGAGSVDFKYGGDQKDEIAQTIIDFYYVQDGNYYLSPVDEELAAAIKAFVKYCSDNFTEYKDKSTFSDENTWLEMCCYYRTVGGSHDGANHNCLAHYNSAYGKLFRYAVELQVNDTKEGTDTNTVDLTKSQRKNRGGGLFYALKAEQTGVYLIESLRPYSATDPIDPHITIWPETSDAYPEEGCPVTDLALLEQEDAVCAEKFLDNQDNKYTNNFKAFIYLESGTTVYLQLSVRGGDISTSLDQYENIETSYEVKINYLGESTYELEVASTGDGNWLWTDDTQAESVYGAVPVSLNRYDNIYYNIVEEENASPLYIEFLHDNYLANVSLEHMIENGAFNIRGAANYTPQMNAYLAQAKSKEPDDPTYGMVPASQELVLILCEYLKAERDDPADGEIDTGLWEAFAYYWHYYGSTGWQPMPTE